MTDVSMSQSLREPLVLIILVLAIAGWLAFFAVWINSSGTASSQQQAIAALSTERDDVAADLAAHQSANGSLEDLNSQISKAQQDLAANTASLTTVKTELSAQQTELQSTTAGLEAARSEAETLSQASQAAEQKAAALTTQQNDLAAQIEAANQQLTDVGARLEEARQLEATATANSAQLTAEAATTTANLADLQAQLQTAREQLTTAQTQLADVAAQSETAGGDLQATQQQLSELQSRREQLAAEVDGYQSQRDTLQPQVDQLTQTLADRSNELADVEERIAQGVAATDAAASTGRFVVSTAGTAQGLTLTLRSDNSFDLRNRAGREVTGKYSLDEAQLVLSDADGNLGTATFPMTCPIERNDAGFTIGAADGCALAGLEFAREL